MLRGERFSQERNLSEKKLMFREEIRKGFLKENSELALALKEITDDLRV